MVVEEFTKEKYILHPVITAISKSQQKRISEASQTISKNYKKIKKVVDIQKSLW